MVSQSERMLEGSIYLWEDLPTSFGPFYIFYIIIMEGGGIDWPSMAKQPSSPFLIYLNWDAIYISLWRES